MEFHEFAGIFPLLEEAELQELAVDIKQKGLIDPVFLYEGKILDGRNRYRACLKAEVEPRFEEYNGDDPVGFVVSKNLKRRHLNQSQLGFVALNIKAVEAERAKQRVGGRPAEKTPAINGGGLGDGDARDIAAKQLGVSHGYVTDAERIRREAPDLEEKVMAGKMHITQAMRALKEAARQKKRDENAAKLEDIPELATVEEVQQLFSTIVIDPPWSWDDEGDADQLGRARPTYKTMSFEELMDLRVASLAAPNAHLYLWITNRSLPKGFLLIEKWGFRYVTCLTWVKPSFGMGNYFRGQTEHILFGVKGSLMLKRKDVGTALMAPRGLGGHSSKPVEAMDLIESCSPGPYLEMFARSHRTNWYSWGENAIQKPD